MLLVLLLLGGLGGYQSYWVPNRLEPDEEAIVRAMHRIRTTEFHSLLDDWPGTGKRAFRTTDLSGLLTARS